MFTCFKIVNKFNTKTSTSLLFIFDYHYGFIQPMELTTPTACSSTITAISMINNIHNSYFFALSLLKCITRHFQLTVKIVTFKNKIYSMMLLNVKDS